MPTKSPPKNGNGKPTNRVAPLMDQSPVSVDIRTSGLGRTGLRQWSGRIDEEFLKELKNERKYQVYKEMSENDPIVGAVLRAIEFLIRGVDWRLEAEDQSDEAQQSLAEDIEKRLFGMARSWPELLVEILSFLPYGWSFHEVLYEARPDGIYWRDWPIRAQETLYKWEFVQDAQGKDTDQVIGLTQQVPTDATIRTIPLAKGLHFRLESHKNNPEGRSILRNAYLPWYYKNHLQRIEAIGIERDLAGYPVLYVPGEVLDNPSGPSYLAAQKIVTNIRRDEQEGALLSSTKDAQGNSLWELKLLSTGGTRAFNTNEIIQRYDTRIAQTCLADFIVLGQAKVGSFALASSKTEIFSLSLAAVLDTICGVVNRQAIPPLAELNGWPTDNLPKLVHGDIELPDLQEIGQFITALSGAGIPLFPDFKLENRLREMGGLPALSQAEFDDREATAAADKQAQMDAQLAAAKAGADAAGTKADQANQSADAADAKAQKALEAVADRFDKRDLPPAVPPPHFDIHLHQGATSVTAPAAGAQTFNVTLPEQHTQLVQPIELKPVIPVTNVVEAAKAAETHIDARTTVQASVIPAPQVTVPVTVESPTLVQPAEVQITNVLPNQEPPVVKAGDVIVKTDEVAAAIREQTGSQQSLWQRALDVIERVFKRPKKLDITLPDGKSAEVKPREE